MRYRLNRDASKWDAKELASGLLAGSGHLPLGGVLRAAVRPWGDR